MENLLTSDSPIAQKARAAAAARAALALYCRLAGVPFPAYPESPEREGALAEMTAAVMHLADLSQQDPWQVEAAAHRTYRALSQQEIAYRRERNDYEPVSDNQVEMIAAEMRAAAGEPPATVLISFDDDGSQIHAHGSSVAGTLYLHYKPSGEVISYPLDGDTAAVEGFLAELTDGNPPSPFAEVEAAQQARFDARTERQPQ